MVRGVAARQLGDPGACDLLHDFLGYLADRESLLGVAWRSKPSQAC